MTITNPDLSTSSYGYDGQDNLDSVTDYSYDALDRLTAIGYPATPAEDVTYGYDDTTGGNEGVGRLTSIGDVSGSTAFTYDHRGNVTQEL
ncbi:MAG: hypothetical protein MI824_11460, partial [Hyphomicrobiales bacterium]|nr:hypothetical protein [Hyphomicrobiales bacterium]